MKNQKQNSFLKASQNAEHALSIVAYKGQDPSLRMYKKGYEQFMNAMPALDENDAFLPEKVSLTKKIMKKLGNLLAGCAWVKDELTPGVGGFNRTILAMEEPQVHEAFMPIEPNDDYSVVKEGTEIVMARWGDGHASPVHGHAAGYLHEEIIHGRMLINIYRMLSPTSETVRLVKSEIVENGTFASQYTKPNPQHKFKRQTLIHNFKSIGNSATLHYLPEHTRDGRDNKFEVQYFEDWFGLNNNDITRITSQEAMYSQKGDVILVRSENVPEYGDHYIVITGAPVVKEHGLRPRDTAIIAPNTKEFLDTFELKTGLVLLKFNKNAKEAFLEFHNIKIDEVGDVVFPDPNSEEYTSVSACSDNAHIEHLAER